jgi:RepB DNA-primase from phage plasmid
MNLDEAESLLHAMAREFGGDSAATDATRVLRLSGFANKKYGTNFYVKARRKSTETYHLRDFKLHIDSQDFPRHSYENHIKRVSPLRSHLSQSEHDWAFAKRALTRGNNPEQVVEQIAKHRAADKPDPLYYARLTVQKARAEIEKTRRETESSRRLESTPQNEPLNH